MRAHVPSTTTISWVVPDDPTLTAELNSAARGMGQLMVFDSIAPPLRTLCPALPWTDVAGVDEVHIPYMWISSVAWAMFRLHDAAEDLVVDDMMLSPAVITRGLRRLVDQGLSMEAQHNCQVALYIHDHVRAHPHADYELQEADMGRTDPVGTTSTTKPAARVDYASGLTLGQMTTPTRSTLPMCMYEYVMGPRIMNAGDDGRHNPKSHHAKMWSKLTSIQASLDTAVHPLVSAKAPKEDIADAQLAAAGELFASFRCPRTVLPFSFTKATKSPIRARCLQVILDWHYHEAKHGAIRRAAFDSYTLGFRVLSIILRPSPDPEQAYVACERLRMEIMPSSTDLDEATMATLDVKVRPYATALTLDSAVARGLTVVERTQMVLDAFSNQSVAVAQPVGAPHGSTSTGGNSGSGNTGPTAAILNADWTAWVNSTAVKSLEADTALAMSQTPIPTVSIINKIHRSGEPIVIQLLHNRSSVPGSVPLSRVPELRHHCRATMSYLVTASPDPADPAKKRLVVHKRWQGFVLSRELYSTLFSGNFKDIDPHQLVYELMSKRTPGTTKASVSKAVRWSQYVHNAKVAVFLDRIFHFLGYKNGVFSDFIAPVQSLLEDIESCDADDKADHQEDLSKIVVAGLREVEDFFKTMLKTGSPFASFPNNGLSLLHSGSNFYAELAALETDLDGAVTTDARWRRKAAKRSRLDAQASSLGGPPPSLLTTLPTGHDPAPL